MERTYAAHHKAVAFCTMVMNGSIINYLPDRLTILSYFRKRNTIFTKHYYDEQMKEDEMGGTYSTHKLDEI
jgi:hypothetical protein